MPETEKLILASGSATRRSMLEAAGLSFTVRPAEIDEGAIRQKLLRAGSGVRPADVAHELARLKAEAVSRQCADGLVIGADQILSLDGEIFEKAEDAGAARTTLMRLRGATHQLHSVVVLAENGKMTWSSAGTAHLEMRMFSAAFLEEYILKAGDSLNQSVGAYQIEGLGAQLFERIEGDHFTILGLPLMPLLAELRRRDVIAS